MEGLDLSTKALAALSGKRVFLTGHTGFKGSWLTVLLARLGCKVHGLALPPRSQHNLYEAASVRQLIADETMADIRDRDAVTAALRQAGPDIVVHMAAQAFVRHSYAEPAETWDVNLMGTVSLLEAVRAVPSVRGVVVVTTDKCYENRGWEWGYRETDRLGGHDPYSASKAGAELVVESYRSCFFSTGNTRLVSARAGNVIGGGDWSEDRLIPDAARAAAAGEDLIVRNPGATRPWQHVLDCLGGYLNVASKLLETPADVADAYNFGPDVADNVSVGEVLTRLQQYWPELRWALDPQSAATAPHEATYLYLDSARARQQLGWRPVWALDTALERTASWYRQFQSTPLEAWALMQSQIEEYLS